MSVMTKKAFNNISHVLSKYLCDGTYTEDVHKVISSCKQTDMELFSQIIGMPICNHLTVNEYVMGINTDKTLVKKSLSFSYKSMKDYRLYFYDVDSIRNLMDEKSTIICKPIHCKISKSRHIIMLIIDKRRKKFILFDPNCNVSMPILIEQNIIQIVNKFNNTYNDNYHYEHFMYDKAKKLNRFESANVSGLCVSISLLIVHYMMITGQTLNQTVKLFSTLSDNHLINIIRSYSLFYYVCCHQI